MAFDAARVRVELVELERRAAELRAQEGDDDDDELFDVIAEVNELRDVLRNHENFPAIWESLALPQLADTFASAEEHCEGCWHLSGLLEVSERAALLASVLAPPGLEHGKACDDRGRSDDRGGDDSRDRGPIRRSDDLELAEAIWPRLKHLLPISLSATVAPAAEAQLRQEMWPEFRWSAAWAPSGLHVRTVYELSSAEANARMPGREIAVSDSGFRLDTEESDDRDESDRALMSLAIALSSDDDDADSGTLVVFKGAPALELKPGHAALFRRGDARFAYLVQPCAGDAQGIVAHMKVLYGLPGA